MSSIPIPPAEEALVRRGLRRAMIENRLALRDVAKLLGVDVSRVSRAMTGSRPMYPAAQVAAAFGFTVADLISPCPKCRHMPPKGYTCNTCGSSTSILTELHMSKAELDLARSLIAFPLGLGPRAKDA